MSEVNTIAIIIETLENIQLLDINDFTDGKYTLTEADVDELKILSAKYDALVNQCARMNLRDYLLKDYDMTDAFIDGVNDVIDNRSSDIDVTDLESRVTDCEYNIDSKIESDDVHEIVSDKIDDALDDLRISRG